MEVYSYKRIIQITAPLMLGTFVQSIVTMTDGIFVSKLGTIEIGAFGNGSLLYLAFFMLCRGLADGAQITIARQKGEGLFSKIGETLKATQIFQLMITAFILFAFILFGNQLIEYFNSDSPITEPMKDFINVRLWGIAFCYTTYRISWFFYWIRTDFNHYGFGANNCRLQYFSRLCTYQWLFRLPSLRTCWSSPCLFHFRIDRIPLLAPLSSKKHVI